MNGMILACIWPPEAMIEPPGGRIRISAPTPRARLACSFSIPSLKPTSVSTIVTWMLMAIMPSSVRTGRCFRFSKTSLLVKLFVERPPGAAGTARVRAVSLRANPALRNIFSSSE